MPLFCPACQAAFPGASRCPRCDGLLLAPQETPDDGPAAARPEPLGPPSLLNRLTLGVLSALGVYMGLRRVASAAVLAAEPDPAAWWASAGGTVTIFGVQALAAFVGGLLAGSARSRGMFVGFAVGGLCGGLLFASEVLAGAPTHMLALYLQPPLLALLGGAAGAVGGRVWPAVPELITPAPATKTLSSVRLLIESDPIDPGKPTLWLKVFLGAAIMAGGVLMADRARMGIQRASAGALRVESVGQGKFVSWQLATLLAAAGGAVAAASTGAGARHGLYAGLLAGAGVAVVLGTRGGDLPPQVSYTLDQFSLPSNSFDGPNGMAIALSVLAVGLVGGWLGGQLFLPLAPAHMRNRRRVFD